ncbi:MAG: hypothetical protein P4L80_02245 [Xanthobacteraceae bacterium]|nr:hypothetical protein [Xanthobacteraceae bacterium]
MHRRSGGILALLFLGLCGGAASGQEAQEGRDMKLEDVGFVMRPANTAAQLERLRLLPPRAFVGRSKDGRRYFLYVDPDYCKCVFVGDELAMKNYRDLVSQPPQAPMAIGSDDNVVANGLIQEIDPGLGLSIVEGDILDYPN